MTTETTTEVSAFARGRNIIETATKKELVEHALTLGVIKTKTEGTKMLLSVLREKVRLFVAEARRIADEIEARVEAAQRRSDDESAYAMRLLSGDSASEREAAEAAEAGYGASPRYSTPEPSERRFSSHARNAGEVRSAQMRRRKRNQRKHRRTLSRLRHNGAVRG